MNKLDLIIDALESVWTAKDMDLIDDAADAARELRELKPACWITPDGEGFRMRFDPPVNDVPMGWTKLYALGDEK